MLLQLQELLRHNLFIVNLRLRSRGENPKSYISKRNHTDICIEGYPRSANSYAVRMFQLANLKSNISHHTHSISNLNYAIQNNIPAVALIREPQGAIVSSMIAKQTTNYPREIFRYIFFYRFVQKNINDIIVAEFNIIINDFNRIVRTINYHFQSKFQCLENIRQSDSKVKSDIEKRYDRLGQEKMAHIKPVPSVNRETMKAELRVKVIQHEMFSEAEAIYKQIMATDQGGNK